MQLQGLERQLSQLRSDIVRPLKAVAAVPCSDMDEEVLHNRDRENPPFLLQSPRRIVRGLGDKLRFGRINFRRERHHRFAKAFDRLLIVRPRRSCQSADRENKDESTQQGPRCFWDWLHESWRNPFLEPISEPEQVANRTRARRKSVQLQNPGYIRGRLSRMTAADTPKGFASRRLPLQNDGRRK